MDTGNGAQLLLTGATGFLGKVVLHDLLARRQGLGIERVHLLIRPQRRSAEERFEQEIASSPCFAALSPGWRRHVRVVPGDLVAPGGLLAAQDELSGRLTHLIHCAASVEFDLPLPDALAANTTSALRILELAQGCRRLVSLLCVSTAYVTPHREEQGPIEEVLAPLPRPAAAIYDGIASKALDERTLLRETRHPNTYTLTKCLAEHLLAERRGAVPLTLVRPSIISASLERPSPGWIDSPAAFALFVMAAGTGKLRALVADPRARIDIVPCDEVSRRVVDAAFAPPDRGLRILHAVAGPERSLPLSVCRRGVERWFQCNPVGDGGPAARIHYLGPPGPRFLAQHRRHHLSRRDAHLVAPKLEEMNERFAYFTRNSFSFMSSVPMLRPDFEPERYIETVSRGVAIHLLDADLRRVSIGGRAHPRPRRWLSLRATGISRWAALRAERRLAAQLERVSFDRLSFEDALADATAPIGLCPGNPDELAEDLLTHLVAAQPDLWPGPVRILLRDAAERSPGLRLCVAIERNGDRVHLRCEAPAETSSAPARAAGHAASRPLLITGASGFLGGHLLEALAASLPEHGRIALVRDPESFDRTAPPAIAPIELAVGSVLESARWGEGLPRLGGIFHLAALVRHSRRGSEEVMETNVEGCLSMVRLAAQHGCRLVLVSTSGTVGCFTEAHGLADEGAPWCTDLIERWPYYASKRQAEESALDLALQLGVELVIIRPPVLLGPGDHRCRSTQHVRRALEGKLPFAVRGGMHFADVRDAASALVHAMEHPDPQPVYHLPGTICSIQAFFEMIEELSGMPGPRFVLPARPARAVARLSAGLGISWLPDPVVVEMASHHWGTTSLYAREDLDYQPRSGKETLADTIAWIRAHGEAGAAPTAR